MDYGLTSWACLGEVDNGVRKATIWLISPPLTIRFNPMAKIQVSQD